MLIAGLVRAHWRVNAKRIYRLYGLEGMEVQTKPRKKLASRVRVPLPTATRPNERWSMDFVSARLAYGRWFRTLTVLDLYTRESLNRTDRTAGSGRHDVS
jgi:putative transposase